MSILKYLKALSRFLLNSDYRFLVQAGFGRFNTMPDEEYLRRKFKACMGRELNLETPVTFNEKLQWLKLYDRNPKYTMLVDKYQVREYIKDKLGEEYLIPLLGVWNDPSEIDFDALPQQFVLKCNHNSGLGMCICKDKSKLDISNVRSELRKGLKQDYYLTGREWHYKNVPKIIICEQYMEDGNGLDELTDYKFFCFQGNVNCVMACTDRSSGNPKFYFFDQQWNLLRYNKRGKEASAGFTPERPENLDQMFEIASELSKDLRFSRIDLYSCGGKVYFGEITFFPDSGFDSNFLPEADKLLGSMISLD